MRRPAIALIAAIAMAAPAHAADEYTMTLGAGMLSKAIYQCDDLATYIASKPETAAGVPALINMLSDKPGFAEGVALWPVLAKAEGLQKACAQVTIEFVNGVEKG